MSVEAVLVAIAGFLGGFVSTLASNGSSVTLPALEFFGLADHTANGTNRLSVVALGLVATISFWREGLIDWRAGARIAVIIAVGTLAGSFIAVELSDAVLDAFVISGLLVVLALLLLRPGRWLDERDEALRPFDRRQAAAYFAIGVYAGLVVLGSGFFMLAALVLLTGCELRQANAMKALILLVVGAQSLLIFEESGDVDWAAGIPWRSAAEPERTSRHASPPGAGRRSGSTASSCSRSPSRSSTCWRWTAGSSCSTPDAALL